MRRCFTNIISRDVEKAAKFYQHVLGMVRHIVEEYRCIKAGLSDHNGTLTDSYQDAKKPFVDRISLEALSYFSEQA